MAKSILLASIGVATLLTFTPVQAAPNAQLVRSVQNDLNLYGFSNVDAKELTGKQISALYLRFSNSVGLFGAGATRRKQEIKVILGWAE
ncbi:MAG: hypothetical protein ABJ327_16255 [Litoreibacter sp.]